MVDNTVYLYMMFRQLGVVETGETVNNGLTGHEGKLSASSMSSLAMAIINGGLVLVAGGLDFTGQGFVDIVVYSTLFLNIIFFYYFEVHTEINPAEQDRLSKIGKKEWWVRVFNQCLLSFLIFLFGARDYLNFFLAFIILYVGFLLWDWLVYGPILTRVRARVSIAMKNAWYQTRGQPEKILPVNDKIPPVILYDSAGLVLVSLLSSLVLGEKILKGYVPGYFSPSQLNELKSIAILLMPHETNVGFVAGIYVFLQIFIIFVSVAKTKFNIFKFFFDKKYMA